MLLDIEDSLPKYFLKSNPRFYDWVPPSLIFLSRVCNINSLDRSRVEMVNIGSLL